MLKKILELVKAVAFVAWYLVLCWVVVPIVVILPLWFLAMCLLLPGTIPEPWWIR